jgi:hypothetical protein
VAAPLTVVGSGAPGRRQSRVVDPSVRPLVILLMAPLFVALGLYLALGRPLPGQTRVLHVQLGVGSILMGLFVAVAGFVAP